jgi:hypothetical protein
MPRLLARSVFVTERTVSRPAFLNHPKSEAALRAYSAACEIRGSTYALAQSVGQNHVYAASTKTKVEGMLANVTPGTVKGAMHEKMAKPKAS